ncbi:hypothetical protein U1Q18_004358 [Sarracenia purpurea var. burkii]
MWHRFPIGMGMYCFANWFLSILTLSPDISPFWEVVELKYGASMQLNKIFEETVREKFKLYCFAVENLKIVIPLICLWDLLSNSRFTSLCSSLTSNVLGFGNGSGSKLQPEISRWKLIIDVGIYSRWMRRLTKRPEKCKSKALFHGAAQYKSIQSYCGLWYSVFASKIGDSKVVIN